MSTTRKALPLEAIFSALPDGFMRLIARAEGCGTWRMKFTNRDTLEYQLSFCVAYQGMPRHFTTSLLRDFDQWNQLPTGFEPQELAHGSAHGSLGSGRSFSWPQFAAFLACMGFSAALWFAVGKLVGETAEMLRGIK